MMSVDVQMPRLAGARVRDIAAETGVSIATVSRALNNRANVAPHTRELVRGAAERLSRHSAAPRPSRRERGAAVLVRCPYVLTDYFGIIVSSIAETLNRHGRRVIL